ncbi:hypothetical protein AMTR_s00007p00244860 [Amborella trichopoda]|uniref:Uncharacterized protein n=1 Tax=Amborella trichopoda TaxID=13333 RepID=W1PEG5_AMBTC|nr:hypothetical protein AMTR_s00007p00244860 [Amborella trichopoda]
MERLVTLVFYGPEIVEEERQDFSNAVVDPTVEEPSPRGSHSQAKIKALEGCQSLPFEDMTGFGPHSSTPQSGGVDMDVLFRQTDFITRLAEPSTSVELQFMQDFHVALGQPNQSRTQNPENLSELRDGKDGSNDDLSIGLQLGDHSTKRRRTSS